MNPNPTNEPRFVIDRTLNAPIENVWKLWTTKEGLEAWWGPERFESVAADLDLRVGGRFEIVMTAKLPAIVEHLKASGFDASSVAKGRYAEVQPHRRLAYENAVDFVPGIAPYTTVTTVEMWPAPAGGTRLVVTNDVMHDAQWTEMAKVGWEQQIAKLAKSLA